MVLGGLSFSFVNKKYQQNSDFFFHFNILTKIVAYKGNREITIEVDIRQRGDKVYFFVLLILQILSSPIPNRFVKMSKVFILPKITALPCVLQYFHVYNIDYQRYWADCPFRLFIRNISTTATFYCHFNIQSKIVAYKGNREITIEVDSPVAWR